MTDNTNLRRQGRHGPSAERDAPTDVQPLEVKKLARIWRQLPEADRLPFLVALDEQIGNQLFEATMPQVADTMPDPWCSDSKDVDAWVARQYARIAAEPDTRPPTIDLNKLNPADLKRVMNCTSPAEFAELATELGTAQSAGSSTRRT